MHDDQHSTTVVVLTGFINSSKVVSKSFDKLCIVINGAGIAGIAISKLLAEHKPSISEIILCDRNGPIYKGRTENMNP